MEKTEIYELVEKSSRGDAEAFSVLYEEYYGKVDYLCFKLLQNREDTNDIVQETFLTAFQNISTLNDGAAFERWLKTIAVNKCKNYLKKARPVLFSQLDDGDGAEFVMEGDQVEKPEEIVDNAEIRKIISEIIDSLPDEQRIAVMLYYYDEMSVPEIAGFMECSEGTVKSRLNYARRKIREEIEGIEKRYNIKLHSGAVIPLLAPILTREVLRFSIHPTFESVMSGAAGAAGAVGGAAAGSGFSILKLLKKLFKTTAAKVVAGVLSAAVVACGVGIAVNSFVGGSEKGIGNTSGNLRNGGTAALQGDYIYFSYGRGDAEGIYAVKTDEFQYSINPDKIENYRITSDRATDINVVGKWIYYNNGGIYAVKTDGSEGHIVTDDDVYYMLVVDDWIYYSMTDGLYAIKTDGTEKHIIDSDIVRWFYVVDDWVYYTESDSGIFAVRTDGSDKRQLTDDSPSSVNVVDDLIYYSVCNNWDPRAIYRMKTDGSEKRMIAEDVHARRINVVGDWIYYVRVNDYGLYAIKTDGSEAYTLIDFEDSSLSGYSHNSVSAINVVGDWIYFSGTVYGEYGEYAIKTDGSKLHKIVISGD